MVTVAEPVVGVEVAEAQPAAAAPVRVPPPVAPIGRIVKMGGYISVGKTDESAAVIVIVIAIVVGVAHIVVTAPAGIRVRVVVGVRPAEIVIGGLVPRIHRRVGKPHTEADPRREGEAAPGILPSRRLGPPSDGESDDQRRSDQPTHDVPSLEDLPLSTMHGSCHVCKLPGICYLSHIPRGVPRPPAAGVPHGGHEEAPSGTGRGSSLLTDCDSAAPPARTKARSAANVLFGDRSNRMVIVTLLHGILRIS